MTFLKEKGASLWGQGSFSLGRGGRERESQGEKSLHSPVPTLSGTPPLGSLQPGGLEVPRWSRGGPHGQDSCPLGHSLLRPHVRLRDTDFVHKLAKADSIVTGELAQDLGWASTGKKGGS